MLWRLCSSLGTRSSGCQSRLCAGQGLDPMQLVMELLALRAQWLLLCSITWGGNSLQSQGVNFNYWQLQLGLLWKHKELPQVGSATRCLEMPPRGWFPSPIQQQPSGVASDRAQPAWPEKNLHLPSYPCHSSATLKQTQQVPGVLMSCSLVARQLMKEMRTKKSWMLEPRSSCEGTEPPQECSSAMFSFLPHWKCS